MGNFLDQLWLSLSPETVEQDEKSVLSAEIVQLEKELNDNICDKQKETLSKFSNSFIEINCIQEKKHLLKAFVLRDRF